MILLAAAGALVWVSQGYGRQRQDRVMATAQIAAVTFVLLLIWCIFLSRIRRKIRLSVLGSVVGLMLLGAGLFRIHGVTGDLVPVVQWRWSRAAWVSPAEQGKPALTPAASNEFTNDYPQFLGPNRNATVPQLRLARDWQAQPPQRLWLQPVGPGWSGFAVAGSRAITQEQRGEMETVDCYDVPAGAPVWSYSYPAHFQSTLAGEGPRATPTVAGNRVYALGSTGVLNCLDLETGKLIWSKDVVQENHAKVNVWGMSSSPLLVDDLVVVEAGGETNRSLVAYRAASGDFAWGGGNADDMQKYAAELVALAPDVIMAAGGTSIGPLFHATKTVPIVFANVPDPVGSGFVETLSRPGRNTTGFMQFEYNLSGKWLELLKQVMPSVTSAGILWDPTLTAGIGQFAVIQSVASSLGVEVRAINLRDAEEVDRAVAAFAESSKGGLIVTASALALVRRERIVALAARHKLPAIYFQRIFVDSGGLISYGPDFMDQYRRAAGYVDRILRGEKPSDMPVQGPTKYELLINLKAAKQLGLTMPSTLLARADEVIE